METDDGRRGALITERRAEAPGYVLLDIQGGAVVEVAFAGLRPVEVA